MSTHPASLPRRRLLRGTGAFALLSMSCMAPARQAAPPLRLGEINSYGTHPAVLAGYRKGWQLAMDQINARGGVRGRPLQVVSRDDGGTPAGAWNAALQLLAGGRIDILFGGLHSANGLALADVAAQNRAFYLATRPPADALVWSQGNRYTWRLGPSSRMHAAALAPRALGLRRRRWALVYSDDIYGRGIAATFRAMMQAFQPRIAFVAELPVAPGRVDAAAMARRLAQAQPDAVFNTLLGTDLAALLQASRQHGLFEGRAVVAPLAGDPEQLAALGKDAPQGWVVSGYPVQAIDTPEHRAFAQAYRERNGAAPQAGSLLGYTAMQALAAGLEKADDMRAEALVEAFANLELPSPCGPIRFRGLDHQSTLGVYTGITALQQEQVEMTQVIHTDGARLQPPDTEVRRLRPADPPATTSATPSATTAG
ncbi:ABC transporter substrate-binding protein [Bordetella sp. 2513F-2]